MTYTITHEKLDQNQFLNWLHKPPRYSSTEPFGTQRLIDTLPDGRIEIMIIGRSGWDTIYHRHVIMRYKYTHISFYPSDSQESRFICTIHGEFKPTSFAEWINDPDPSYRIFRLDNAYTAADARTPAQITTRLNEYFGLTNAPPTLNASGSVYQNFEWKIPDANRGKWNFKFFILTVCGIGCLVKKANCTSIVVDALRIAGLTTDLNARPSMWRALQDSISIFCLIYLIAHTIKYSVTNQEHDIAATIVASFEFLTFILYTVIVYCQPKQPVNQKQALPIPSDDGRVENFGAFWRYCCSFRHDVLRYTNASRLLMIMSLIFVILDILIDLANGQKIEIIPSRRDGIVLSNIRLTTVIAIVLFTTRFLLLFKAAFTDIQNGPQNPMELSHLLRRVATAPRENQRQQTQDNVNNPDNIDSGGINSVTFTAV